MRGPGSATPWENNSKSVRHFSPGWGIESRSHPGGESWPSMPHEQKPFSWKHRSLPTRRSVPPTWSASAAVTPSSANGSRRCWPPTTGAEDPRRATSARRRNRPHPRPRKRPRRSMPQRVHHRSWPPRGPGRTARISPSQTPRADLPAGSGVGQVIAGRYTLLGVLGEGGWAPSTGRIRPHRSSGRWRSN